MNTIKISRIQVKDVILVSPIPENNKSCHDFMKLKNTYSNDNDKIKKSVRILYSYTQIPVL